MDSQRSHLPFVDVQHLFQYAGKSPQYYSQFDQLKIPAL